MPHWMRGFAVNQPFTQVIDAIRGFAGAGPVGNHWWVSLLWLAGIMAVFVPLAVGAYRRAS
jgi:hypothetical protein